MKLPFLKKRQPPASTAPHILRPAVIMSSARPSSEPPTTPAAVQERLDRFQTVADLVVKRLTGAPQARTLDATDLANLAMTSRGGRVAVNSAGTVAWAQVYGAHVPHCLPESDDDYRRLVGLRDKIAQTRLPRLGYLANAAPVRRFERQRGASAVHEAWVLLQQGRTAEALVLLQSAGDRLACSEGKRAVLLALSTRPVEAAYFARVAEPDLPQAWTRLALAWRGGYQAMVHFVMEQGVDLSAVHPVTRSTALHTAVWHNNRPLTCALLAAGASPTVQAEDGCGSGVRMTPVLIAARERRVAILAVLLDHLRATNDTMKEAR